nr:sugar ABC transporter substrate-binding protein [Rhodococcus sp. (in: high G+C Gram-positive bacteria)]
MFALKGPRAMVAVAALVAITTISGCSKGPAPTNSSADASAEVPAAVAGALAEYSGQPSFVAPGEPIDISSLRGKKIFDIPAASNPFIQDISTTMEEVAGKAGMVYTRYDNQSTVSQWIQGMNQAISSRQDIIVLNGSPDPRSLQPQLRAAKDAGIPVLVTHFHDNTMPPPPACEGCVDVTATVNAPLSDVAKVAADWMIKDSGGQANVLIVGGSDIFSSPGTIESAQNEFAAQCPDCSTTVVNLPVSDWNTKTQSVVQSALQANPTVNYIYPLYDAMVTGAIPAVRTLAKTGQVKIVSYNGSPFALDEIRESDGSLVAMDVGEDTRAVGYANMDQAFRVLLGQPPVAQNTPIRIWDSTNVAEAGSPAKVGEGYGDAVVTGYQELWGLPS